MAGNANPALQSPRAKKYTWAVQLEHRGGNVTQSTIHVTNHAKGDVVQGLWKAAKHDLNHKEKALAALGLLDVRAEIVPSPEENLYHARTSSTSRSAFRPLKLITMSDLSLSVFSKVLTQMSPGEYTVRFTVFDKQPLITKIGRAVVVVLAVGAQVGLSFVDM
ncbi:uncharacterized protein DSM5745_08402 [Aspergillus mulundensis]|uniref:Uncharacterized protein n=1 Tax=Aspergillus mulundensis TaxID=1810919 RepID=A0A3D8RAH9_9EURO|nr:hypothetical protein DSM5745_08402 [Aspergillus mulundensis]RDW70891.1 hypothetical protein DSM5745_08402 [Aspergillus mulundensis]